MAHLHTCSQSVLSCHIGWELEWLGGQPEQHRQQPSGASLLQPVVALCEQLGAMVLPSAKHASGIRHHKCSRLAMELAASCRGSCLGITVSSKSCQARTRKALRWLLVRLQTFKLSVCSADASLATHMWALHRQHIKLDALTSADLQAVA